MVTSATNTNSLSGVGSGIDTSALVTGLVNADSGTLNALKTKQTSTLRCSSGGDNTLLYNPALKVGNALQSLGSDDGCWMLIEGVIK